MVDKSLRDWASIVESYGQILIYTNRVKEILDRAMQSESQKIRTNCRDAAIKELEDLQKEVQLLQSKLRILDLNIR